MPLRHLHFRPTYYKFFNHRFPVRSLEEQEEFLHKFGFISAAGV